MKRNYLLLLFTLFITWNCASTTTTTSGDSPPKVTKKDGFNPNTKKVSTLNVFNLEAKKFAPKTDIVLTSFGATVDAKISEIYGEGIVGGDAITELAKKLKLANYENAVKNLVESELSGASFSADSRQTLNTIVEKGKIDALAVPVVSSGSEKLLKGESLELTVIVYDGRSGKTQILASHNVKAKSEDLQLASTQPDQARANINLTALSKTNELMSALGKEINPNKQIATKKEEKAASTEEKKEDKFADEPLKPLDDWLVSKIKVGLGPIVMGILAVLFFAL